MRQLIFKQLYITFKKYTYLNYYVAMSPKLPTIEEFCENSQANNFLQQEDLIDKIDINTLDEGTSTQTNQ